MTTPQSIILQASEDIRKAVARSLRSQCSLIKKSNGLVTTDLEKRIEKTQKILLEQQSLQNAREALLVKTKNILDRAEKLINELSFESSVLFTKPRRDEIFHFEKKQDVMELAITSGNFLKLTNMRLQALKMDFDKAVQACKERKFGRYGKLTLPAYVTTLKVKLEKLENKLNGLQKTRSINIEKSGFNKLFDDPSETEEIARLFERVTDYCQKQNDIPQKNMKRFVQTLVDTLTPEDYEYRPFEHIRDDEECRLTQEDESVVYDFKKLSPRAIKKGFYEVFSQNLKNHAKALLRDFKQS